MSRRTFREARRYLLAALALEAALAPLRALKGRLLLGVGLACMVFFRDPSRTAARDPETIYAPADGVVVAVEEDAGDDWLGRALRISTFLAIYDVHVNRSPAAGRISAAEETPGGFAPAFLGRATENHRKRLAIDEGDRSSSRPVPGPCSSCSPTGSCSGSPLIRSCGCRRSTGRWRS